MPNAEMVNSEMNSSVMDGRVSSCCTRYVGVIVMIVVVVTGSWQAVGLAQEADSGTTRRLDGWQKAKFGMDYDQVKAQYPEAKEKRFIVERCKSELTEDDVRESPLFDKDSLPHFACRYLVISSYDSGEDLFRVSIFFSRARGRLFQIKMELSNSTRRKEKQVFDNYVDHLKGKYGDPQHQFLEPSKTCGYMAGMIDQVLADTDVIASLIQKHQKKYAASFTLNGGKVHILFNQVQFCEEYVPYMRRSAEWRKAIEAGLDRNSLQIYYHNDEEGRAIRDRF